MQDAINEISSLLDCYPDITALKIYDSQNVKLCYNNPKTELPEEKSFQSDYVSIPLIEWMEENLPQAQIVK